MDRSCFRVQAGFFPCWPMLRNTPPSPVRIVRPDQELLALTFFLLAEDMQKPNTNCL